MKPILFAVVWIALCSCGSKPPAAGPDATKTEAVSKKKQEAGTVTVDDDTLSKGRIEVVTLAERDVSQNVSAPGRLTISEDRTWHVGAIASGKVASVSPMVGDLVRADQVLARIHSHDVHEARAAYRHAIVELDRAKAAEGYAKQRRDRAKRLLELKAGSRQDVETAESEVTNAAAQIEKAQADVTKERSHLTDILHVSVDDSGPHERHETADADDAIPVYAPGAGVVIERKVNTGSVVNQGEVLFTITDPANLWMIASANEADLSRFRAGQTVLIQVAAYPEREFQGRVLKLGEQLDPDTRTLRLRIAVPNPGGLLKPEMYATASLRESGLRRGLFVPEQATQDIGGVPAVFVRRSKNEFEARPVKTGRRVNGELEVLEGLKAGESVVVKGTFLIKSQLLKSTFEEK